MAEPTISAATVAAAISAATLAILGVPSLALMWGMFGAIAMVVFAQGESQGKVIGVVLMSGLVGAAGGNWFAVFAAPPEGSKPLLILASLIVGAGAKTLLSMAVAAVASRIEKAGGSMPGKDGDK